MLEWVAFPFSRGSSQPRDQTQVSAFALQVDSLSAEPPGKLPGQRAVLFALVYGFPVNPGAGPGSEGHQSSVE